MKRRILLLMMTALLSVGAWAENLWTKAEAIDPGDDTKVQFPADLKTSDVIRVTVTITNQYWYHINLYDMTDWWKDDNKLLSSVTMDNNGNLSEAEHIIEIPVTSTIIDAIANSTHYQWLHFYGDGFKMSSVDIARNAGGLTILTSGEASTWGNQKIQSRFISYASVGDVIEVTASRKSNEWGGEVYIKDGADTPNVLGSGWLGDFGSEVPVKISVTDAMLAESNLYLWGGYYDISSVKLIFSPTVTIGSAGYATFGYPVALDLTGIEAYTAAVSGDKVVLSSVKGKKIPANTGIILEGSGDVTISLTTEATDDITGNELLVSDGTVTGDGTIYVLGQNGGKVGFGKLKSGDVLAAGKAYLKVTGSGSPSFIDINDNVTGIQQVKGSKSQVESYYNLNGQRVAQPTKGVYIVNGKKIIIK